MKITGFIPSPDKANIVVPWTLSFSGPDDDLEFLCYESRFGEKTLVAAKKALSATKKEVSLTTIQDPMAVKAVEEELRKSKSSLLVTCEFRMRSVDGVTQNSDALIQSAPCGTFVSLYGDKVPDKVKKVLYITTGYVHDRAILNLLDAFRKIHDVKITIASVEDNSGEKAEQAGEQTIKSLLHDVGFDAEDFEIKAEVDHLKHRGIKKCFDDHDLVIAGMDAEDQFRLLEDSLEDATVAIVKRNPPLRLKSFIEWLPRINPTDHADLIHELRQGSAWGPDFIVMLGLAAAVSTLGLLQDSPAVVIGSMLLAPLMTPMMGMGLALAQANIKLMRMSLKSIILGLFLTVGISFAIGFITPTGETLSEEVLARGSPNVLDLMIALFAAGAAAYAMARPNIIGAIAGVAIATALVPPACSIGISLAHGAWLNSLGAALLFFANLVAIMAASSFTFMFLGITSERSRKRNRIIARLGHIGLILILLSLFAPMSLSLISTIQEGKNVTVAYPVTRAVARAVKERVKQDGGVEVMYMARDRSERGVIIHLASTKNLSETYADELKQIVRQEMNDPNIPVQVVAVKSIWVDEED